MTIISKEKHKEGMHNLKIIDGVEVVSLVGRTLEKTQAVADNYGIKHVSTDLAQALASDADACRTWEATTVLARVDWIHWLESARQAKTRAKRVADACEMLGQGKKRVCCFDPSGFYSKAFRAPEVG